MAAAAKTYDAIVIGLGIMGAAALSALARASTSVLGIDQFVPPHTHGSSHGETRLLRVAYAEGAAYVPMMQRSIVLWREIEQRTGKDLFTKSGVLYLAPNRSKLLASVELSARTHGLPLTERNIAETAPFTVGQDWRALFEPDGGFLWAEQCVASVLDDARMNGAVLQTDCRTLHIERNGKALRIHTSLGTLEAKRIICCQGAWARDEFGFLKTLLRLEQHVLHWYEANQAFDFSGGFAPFVVAPSDEAFLYGFPRSRGCVKLADHYSGLTMFAPSSLGVRVPAAEFERTDALTRTFMPSLGPRADFKPCIYDLSPDEHFILDEHPEMPGVYFLAGTSGHGFKFAPVLGEALANFALGRPQQIDTAFFALKRFS